MSDRLSEIEGRLAASGSAAGTNWEVGGLTVHGGYAAVATDALDVSTDEHLPEECAELFAHAPADLAALVKFAREVEALHKREDDVDSHGRPYSTCSRCLSVLGEHVDWPCPTGAALERLGSAP